MHSFPSVPSLRRRLSSTLRARAVLCAPVVSAVLALGSVAHAQAGPENAAPNAAASPSAAPPSTATPSAATPSAATPSTPAPSPAAPSTSAAPVSSAPSVLVAPEPGDHATLTLPRVHQGFYLRMTSGPSVLSLNGHGPAGSASLTGLGQSGFLSIGGALAPGLVLAGTLQGGGVTADFKGGPLRNATLTLNGVTNSASHRAQAATGMLGVLLDWYPQPTGGWHVGVATGVGGVAVTNLADDSKLIGGGFAGSVFGGYDWALGRDWGVGLQLAANGATSAKLKDDDGHDTGYRLTPLSIGIQASLLYF